MFRFSEQYLGILDTKLIHDLSFAPNFTPNLFLICHFVIIPEQPSLNFSLKTENKDQ